jgi:hypothetical protein
MTATKKITEAQVRKAFEAADRADLAVERHQMRAGYGRSNDRTRELRYKASCIRNKAYELKFAFAAQNA